MAPKTRSSVLKERLAASSFEEEEVESEEVESEEKEDLDKFKPSTAATKRPLEYEKWEKVKDSKRKKMKVGAGAVVADGDDEDGCPQEEDGKKSTGNEKNPYKVGRVWSEDDELVILNGIVGFRKKGIDPVSSLDQFFVSIAKSINANASRDQLNYKIRRLKSKYMNIIKRVEPGQDPTFAKPHDLRCYEIMKEIWGGNIGKMKGGKGDLDYRTPNTRSTRGVSTRGYKNLPMMEESIFKEGNSKGSKELKQKGKKLHVAELEVFLRRLELVQEQTMEVLEALKSSSDL